MAEKNDGVAVLLATHQVELARAVADHVLVLEDGRIIAEGGPDVLDSAQEPVAPGALGGAG